MLFPLFCALLSIFMPIFSFKKIMGFFLCINSICLPYCSVWLFFTSLFHESAKSSVQFAYQLKHCIWVFISRALPYRAHWRFVGMGPLDNSPPLGVKYLTVPGPSHFLDTDLQQYCVWSPGHDYIEDLSGCLPADDSLSTYLSWGRFILH